MVVHGANDKQTRREDLVFGAVFSPRRVSAAHLGWVSIQQASGPPPRGGRVPPPPGGHCAGGRPIGATARSANESRWVRSWRATSRAAARSPTAASQGHSDRQPAATAAQDGSPGQLLIGTYHVGGPINLETPKQNVPPARCQSAVAAVGCADPVAAVGRSGQTYRPRN